MENNKNKKKRRSIFGGVIAQTIVLLFYMLFALFPLFWMVVLSLKSDKQMFTTTFLFNPTLENYRVLLTSGGYLTAFWQSLIVSSLSVLIAIIAGTFGAYALARFKFKGKEMWAFTILSFEFAPAILVVLPLFLIYQSTGLYDSYVGLMLVYQVIVLPLIVWVVRGYFEDIPVELEEAAQLDGYNWLQIFLRRLLPLVLPGVVSAALLSFIFAWNEFTFPLMLAGFNVHTVTVVSLNYLASATVHYGQVAAAATISAIPSIILAISIQRYLVRGLSFGSIKE